MAKYIQCANNKNKNVSIIETINSIKKAGFDGVFVQWFDRDYELSKQEQVSLCKSLNLEIEFAHLSYEKINSIWDDSIDGDNLVEEYKIELNECFDCGINLAVMHVTGKPSTIAQPNMLGIERLQKIVDHAKTLGIKIAFENTKIKNYLEYIFEHISNDNIGVCLDSGHIHCHFNDKFNWDFFKNKILAVHLHDNDSSFDQHLLPFDGTINWDTMAENLKQSGYTGPVTLESTYRDDYLNISIEEFYKLSIERAKQIKL